MTTVGRRATRWNAPPLPRLLAHRGFSRNDVENTLGAFAAARKLGADYVESDIRATADGVAVLFHDPTLDRSFGIRARIRDLTLKRLKELTASRGEIPTLAEALEAFPDALWNLDVKCADAIAPAARVIRDHCAEGRILVASFSGKRSGALSRLLGNRVVRSPGVGRMALVLLCAHLHAIALGSRLLASFVALQIPERQGCIRVVSPRLIRQYHRMGAEVHVWTVDDEDDIRRLLRWGVDGIVTNRIDRALAVVGSRPKE